MRGLKATVVIAGLLALVVPQSAGAYPGPTLPGLTTVNGFMPGTTTEVLGSNFEPGCPINLTLITSPTQALGSGFVAGDGTWNPSFLAPSFSVFSSYGGTILIEMETQSPCNPESATYALIATLPPTL